MPWSTSRFEKVPPPGRSRLAELSRDFSTGDHVNVGRDRAKVFIAQGTSPRRHIGVGNAQGDDFSYLFQPIPVLPAARREVSHRFAFQPLCNRTIAFAFLTVTRGATSQKNLSPLHQERVRSDFDRGWARRFSQGEDGGEPHQEKPDHSKSHTTRHDRMNTGLIVFRGLSQSDGLMIRRKGLFV